MFRLGLQLTLRSGREGLVRLLITAAAVAVGVTLLLGVLAELHAYEANAYQPCWSCTTGANVPNTLPAHGELWNNSVDYFEGQTLSRLDVAALGPNAPVPPGVSRLPAPGTYYASPALEALLATVPADELGDRFPGKLAGTIGQAALNGANDLVIYIGYTPAALNNIAGTQWVTSIYTGAGQQVFSPFFKDAFYVGIVIVLLPLLVLISTATRLAADRREERFAAMRLVGGTPADIRTVATIEAMLSSFAGAVIGSAIFLLLRPLLAGADLLGTPYFESDLTPTAAGYVAMLIGVPVAAAVAAVVSLHRVQISPLGVSRRTTPKRPSLWRLVILALGIALFVYGLWTTTHKAIAGLVWAGLVVTMFGLVAAGPWFTVWTARLLRGVGGVGGGWGGSSALLAARRLADNPRVAFRAVTGLVLAVFLGTMVGTLAPAVNALQATHSSATLSNILIGPADLSAAAGQRLIHGIDAIPGATAYPLYQLPPAPGTVFDFGSGPGPGPGSGSGSGTGTGTGSSGRVSKPAPAPPASKEEREEQKLAEAFSGMVAVSCASLRAIAGLGECAPGVQAVQVDDGSLFDDNPIYQTAPLASASSQSYHGDLTTLPLQTVLVKVNSPATLERVRTYLTLHTAPVTGGGVGSSPSPPRTFGETLAIRTDRGILFEKIMYAAVALTLIVAGCSLAVAVGGGLVERKRPFTLLRVSGAPVSVLTRVILFEAAVPLIAATVLAAGIAYGTSVLAVVRLSPPDTAIPLLSSDYFTIMGIGLAAAFGIICLTLPLLRRMTAPGNVRFE